MMNNKAQRVRDIMAKRPELTSSQIAGRAGVAPGYVATLRAQDRAKRQDQLTGALSSAQRNALEHIEQGGGKLRMEYDHKEEKRRFFLDGGKVLRVQTIDWLIEAGFLVPVADGLLSDHSQTWVRP